MKKVVLAYSGGLDTSCMIPWLKDKGYQTIAFCADLGQGGSLDQVKRKALKAGASKVVCLDLQKEFLRDYVVPTLKAGALYENKYVLACALSRPLIAAHQVKIARKEKAGGLVHGSTGKGNDQVRFETAYRLLAPGMDILAPVRTWEFKTREEEIDYAREKGIPVPVSKKSPTSCTMTPASEITSTGVAQRFRMIRPMQPRAPPQTAVAVAATAHPGRAE